MEAVYPVNFMLAGRPHHRPERAICSSAAIRCSIPAGNKCSRGGPWIRARQDKVGAPGDVHRNRVSAGGDLQPGKRAALLASGSLVAVPGVGGGDEVFFNSGDGNYYVTAGNDPVGPVLGVVTSTS